jgi:peptide/nickel transport system substrate-binding protein
MMADPLARRRRFRLGLLSVLMLGAALAVGLHPTTADAKDPRGTLTIAVATMANESFLPDATPGAEMVFSNYLFEHLVRRDPQTGENLPMLAESWEMRDGAATWVFRLRRGVKFHGGFGEMTCEDVKYTFAKAARPGTANTTTFLKKLNEVQCPDPYTAVVRLKSPHPMMLNEVNSGVFAQVTYVQSKKALERGDDAANRHPIGTGPWEFVSHTFGDRVEYKAVRNHWRKTPEFERLVLLKVPEAATRIAMVAAGQVDIAEVGVDFVKELKAARVETRAIPEFASVGITLGGMWPDRGPGTSKSGVPWAPLEDERARKVRLAFNMAVDVQAIKEQIFGGFLDVTAATMFFPGKPWTPGLKPYGFDPAKARQLMKEAGYPNCFEFTMLMVTWPGRGYGPRAGEAVASMLEKNLGCKIAREPMDRAIFSRHFGARTYPGKALAYAFPQVGTEPWEIWIRVGHSKGAAQISGFEHPVMDDFLDRISREPDSGARAKLQKQMAEWVYKQVPRIELGGTVALFGVSKRVGKWPLVPGQGIPHYTEYITRVD